MTWGLRRYLNKSKCTEESSSVYIQLDDIKSRQRAVLLLIFLYFTYHTAFNTLNLSVGKIGRLKVYALV